VGFEAVCRDRFEVAPDLEDEKLAMALPDSIWTGVKWGQ
jgi:hypothetical protein